MQCNAEIALLNWMWLLGLSLKILDRELLYFRSLNAIVCSRLRLNAVNKFKTIQVFLKNLFHL